MWHTVWQQPVAINWSFHPLGRQHPGLVYYQSGDSPPPPSYLNYFKLSRYFRPCTHLGYTSCQLLLTKPTNLILKQYKFSISPKQILSQYQIIYSNMISPTTVDVFNLACGKFGDFLIKTKNNFARLHPSLYSHCTYYQESIMRERKERRSVKRPRLNEIFVLPGSYSGYTIVSVKLKWPRACPAALSALLPLGDRRDFFLVKHCQEDHPGVNSNLWETD